MKEGEIGSRFFNFKCFYLINENSNEHKHDEEKKSERLKNSRVNENNYKYRILFIMR